MNSILSCFREKAVDRDNLLPKSGSNSSKYTLNGNLTSSQQMMNTNKYLEVDERPLGNFLLRNSTRSPLSFKSASTSEVPVFHQISKREDDPTPYTEYESQTSASSPHSTAENQPKSSLLESDALISDEKDAKLAVSDYESLGQDVEIDELHVISFRPDQD